jgi:undecaprenyl-diphosphatase
MISHPDGPASPSARRWPLAWLEIEVLLGLAAIASLALGFVLIAGAVGEGAGPLDERIMLSMRTPGDVSDPVGPKWVEEAVRDFTALGSTAVLTLLVGSVTIFLLLTRRRRLALTVLICTLTGTALSNLAKYSFARPRPDLVPHQVEVYTASFPSGHALMAAVVYLTLGVLIARTQTQTAARAFIMGFAVFITLLVGFSRVYLGVHWPTDVMAGWCLGALWATLCWLLTRRSGGLAISDPVSSPANGPVSGQGG